MQLKIKKISGMLSLATCSLLSPQAHSADSPWEFDTAILFYSEKDRVSAVEPVVSAKKDLGDDETLSMKLVLDSLTGASANGAVPSTKPQTFTGPSGRTTYTIDPNTTPLDSTFRDSRTAFSLNWEKPWDRNNRRNLGFSLSQESDFTSLGFNASWAHDLNQKNTTLTTAINLETDQINPTGDTPVGLTSVQTGARQIKEDSDLSPRTASRFEAGSGSQDRQVVDLLFGVTQIIDQSSLFQINLSVSQSDGYMTDPYKLLSVVDNNGEPVSYVHELRPDERLRTGIFGKYKKQLSNDNILTASYRFTTDDWGINSHTFDLTYRFKLDQGYFFQPHLRLYQQTSADFYYYFLRDGDVLPEYASADYRLGEMAATTVGFKFGKVIEDQHIWSFRLEQYHQTGDSSPDEAFGQLSNQDLAPDVDALIAQINYSFQW